MPESNNLAKRCLVQASAVLALLLAGPGLAAGQVTLYQQSPDRNFGQASDTLFRLDGGQVTASQVADDFAIPAGGAVCAVAWWGFYGGAFVQFDPPPPANETMRVRFYANAAGLPGTVLAEHTLLNPSRQWTGQFVTGVGSPLRREYLYESALPGCFSAAPGATYWFEVVQVGDVNSYFRWETAPPGNNHFAILFPPGTPWRISGQPDDFAFRLITPEPTCAMLFVCALAALIKRQTLQALYGALQRLYAPQTSTPTHRGLALVLPVLALLFAGPGPAAGQVTLYQQLPDRNFGHSSDTTYLNDGGQPSASIAADSFAMPAGGSVCAVAWWGFYGGTFGLDPGPPAGDETMRVRFYANTAGLPGAVLAEHTLLNPSRAWTGFVVAGSSTNRREYLYESALPGCFAAAPGVTYWFEVVQVGLQSSRFRWETSAQGNNGFAVRFPVSTPWRAITDPPDDLAFRLLTPEPSSAALLLLVSTLAARLKRK